MQWRGSAHNPSPGERVAREAGREWNAGRNVGIGTQKQTFEDEKLQQVSKCTANRVISRVPLPSSNPPVPVAFESTFSPGEGFAPAALNKLNDNLLYDAAKPPQPDGWGGWLFPYKAVTYLAAPAI